MAIYIFRSSSVIEKICEENGWILMAEKSNLFNKVDSRIFFFELLERINCSRNFEVLWSNQIFAKSSQLFEKFGEKIVIQTFSSAGGKGTFFAKKNNIKKNIERAFSKKKKQKNCGKILLWRVSMWLLLAVLRIKNGILSGWARYQFVGVAAIVAGKKIW